jgi:predicted metal-dependent hydrolase
MTETSTAIELPGGMLAYTLRRHPRSRRIRVTIDPRRGLVVTIPPAGRRGWSKPERHVEMFLRERESWIRRHLAALARQRAAVASRDGVADGARLRYRGELHRLRLRRDGLADPRSTVLRVGGEEGDELDIRIAARERRPVVDIVRAWLLERARVSIDDAVARHAGPLGVEPSRIAVRDPRTRWGSATKEGRLMFSWRLVLAPPEALESVVVHELAHLRVFGHGPRFWQLVAARCPDHRHWRRWLREHSAELHTALEEGVVEMRGLEPLTPAMRTRCSPS